MVAIHRCIGSSSVPRNRAVLCLTSHRLWTPTPTPTPRSRRMCLTAELGQTSAAQLSPEKRRIMQSSKWIEGSGRKSPHLRITRPGAPSRPSKLPRGGAKDKNAGGSIAAFAAAKNKWLSNAHVALECAHGVGTQDITSQTPRFVPSTQPTGFRFSLPRLQLPPP